MFIDACQRGGNVDAAVDAAEKHLVMGLTITPRGLERSRRVHHRRTDRCARTRLWRKVDIPVDARCATAVVSAAARVGDADAAAAFAAQFTDAGTPASLEAPTPPRSRRRQPSRRRGSRRKPSRPTAPPS